MLPTMSQTGGLLKVCCIYLTKAVSICPHKFVVLDINLKNLCFLVDTSYFLSFQTLCAGGKLVGRIK